MKSSSLALNYNFETNHNEIEVLKPAPNVSLLALNYNFESNHN